jgi:hypothetical protein
MTKALIQSYVSGEWEKENQSVAIVESTVSLQEPLSGPPILCVSF